MQKCIVPAMRKKQRNMKSSGMFWRCTKKKRNERLGMDEALQYAIENGMIDLSYIRETVEMNKREEILKEQKYKIWQGKDGKWYVYLAGEDGKRRLKKRKTKEEIETVIVDFVKEQQENPTIKEVFSEWNKLRLERKKIKMSTYNRDERFYNRHYKKFGERKIKALKADEIVDFLERQIVDYDLTAKAFSGLLAITRGFLKYAKRKGYVKFPVQETLDDMDLSSSMFKKVIKEDFQEVFDVNDTGKAIGFFENNLDIQNLGLLLVFISGIRVGELAALKHEDFSEDSVKIRRTETCYQDYGGEWHREVSEYPKSEAGVRTVVLPKDYLWVVDKIKKTNPFSEYVFVNKKGERMTTGCFRSRLYRVCKLLDIYPKSPHKIRKTYVTILLDNNLDKELVKNQAGHADISVSENHYHRDRRDHDTKMAIISSIPDFKKTHAS